MTMRNAGAALIVALIGAGPALAAGLQDANGAWARDDGNARVRIAPCGKDICATNTWIRDPKSSEKVGDRLVMTLKPGKDGAFTGTAYDPQRKRTYGMTMTIAPRKLQTRGCVFGGLLCKSVTWTPAS